MDVERILKLLRDHKDELRKNFGVKKIGVFGSYTRREESDRSDIDIYVEFYIDELTFEKYLKLLEYLEALLGRKVDLVTKDGVETIRIPYIKEGIKRGLIYA